MAEDMGEKSEQPTGKRLADARQNGQIAKSQLLGATIDLIGAVLILAVLGGWFVRSLLELMRRGLDGRSGAGLTWDSTQPVLLESARHALIIAVPVLVLMFVVAGLAQFLQVGWLFTLRPLKPKFTRLNPVSGVKRLFSKRNVVKTLVNVVKLAAMVAIAQTVVQVNKPAIVGLPMLDPGPALVLVGRIMLEMCLWMLAFMLILALIDYVYQRYQHKQDLKMTKQEVKDEFRSMEGDPKVKGRRLRMARQIALQRIQSAVPSADVVVTNPTHFAVALKYDSDRMAAPTVVAKGVDVLAMRIRQLAMMHGVPIVEKPPLARALYHEAPVGRQISPQFYQAVAEVLAYVFRLSGKKAAAAADAGRGGRGASVPRREREEDTVGVGAADAGAEGWR
ncbi:MAG: flagellar biosynthesis protein FlhB [Phycisphaeraceae bacterium]|nr:flagellar biosynthesis protein FlhB [Phycisphaeraceae bacterium]